LKTAKDVEQGLIVRLVQLEDDATGIIWATPWVARICGAVQIASRVHDQTPEGGMCTASSASKPPDHDFRVFLVQFEYHATRHISATPRPKKMNRRPKTNGTEKRNLGFFIEPQDGMALKDAKFSISRACTLVSSPRCENKFNVAANHAACRFCFAFR
jgi:hypothetical protein